MDGEITSEMQAWFDAGVEEEVARRIRKEMEARVYYYARRPEGIDERLRELDREWDLERVLETNVGVLSLMGLTFGAMHSRWYLVSALAAACLLQHAVKGWSAPQVVCRRLGIRTAREVNHERFSLKALRGDFHPIGAPGKGTPDERAHRAIEAADLHVTEET